MMKNTIIKIKFLPTLFTLFMLTGLFGSLHSQGQYELGMQKALGLWQDAKPMEASAMFERIAKAEKDNWIPYYYAANTLIVASFESKDVTLINEILKKAATLLEEGQRISPDNSELITLEGLLYTGYVAMDPGTYGMQYSNKIINLHSKAIEVDAENPRAQLNKIEYEIGSARFFNQDLSTFCTAIEETKPLFAKQKKSIPFYPAYGEERIEYLRKECNCK